MMSSIFKDYMANKKKEPDDKREVEPQPEPSPLDRAFPVTFFSDKFAETKTEVSMTLRGLTEGIRNTRTDTKDKLPWLKLAVFGQKKSARGSLRHDKNLVEIGGIEADYDDEMITVDRARTIIAGAGLAAIIYTSPSHTEDTPRWRVLCPTSKQLPPDTRTKLVARVNGLFVGALADESFTLSQSYFYGSVKGNPSHEVVVTEGKAIDLADELDEGAIGRPVKPEPEPRPATSPRTAPIEGDNGWAIVGLQRECDSIRRAPDGTKHATINKAAYSIGGLVSSGALTHGEAFAELSAALESILPYCKDKRAAQNTLRKAFADGMGRPRDVPEQSPVDDGPHPAAALLAKLTGLSVKKAEQSQPKSIPVSPDLMEVGGVLQIIMEECARTAIRAQPFLWLGTAICAVGTLAGRRYESPTGLRTNIYVAGVADSGSGKDHGASVVRRAFTAADLERFLGGENLASGAGLLQSLAGHPARLFVLDELGMFLKTVTGKNAAPHMAEIWSEFIKIFSRAKEKYFGKEYANRDGKNERIDIWYPHPCVYGMTTPSTFWAALEGGSMLDGGLARFLLFMSNQDLPPRNKRPGNSETPTDLIDALQSVAHGPGVAPVGGNLPATHFVPMSAKLQGEVYRVPMTDEADDIHDRHMDIDQDGWAIRRKGTPDVPIISRLGENAIKLALVRAISTNPVAPVIGTIEIEWGWKLALHCARSMLREASRFIADSDYERKLNKALDIIQRHGPITEYEMLRKGFKSVGKDSERRELLQTLISANLITTLTQAGGPSGGRPTVKYVVCGQDAEA